MEADPGAGARSKVGAAPPRLDDSGPMIAGIPPWWVFVPLPPPVLAAVSGWDGSSTVAESMSTGDKVPFVPSGRGTGTPVAPWMNCQATAKAHPDWSTGGALNVPSGSKNCDFPNLLILNTQKKTSGLFA